MNNFIVNIPTKIYFGKDQIKNLPELILEKGKKVLLCYGGGSIKRNGIYDTVVNLFQDNGIEWIELSGIEPNPRVDSVRKGAELVRNHQLDVIIAVGGGSVIDCAKAISVACVSEHDAWELVEDASLIQDHKPVFVILTMAATGSEMNWTSVISNLEKNRKQGFRHPLMYPEASICDPSYTFTLPAYQTACGCADMLSHIFESYFDHVEDCYIQDGLAESVCRCVIKYAPIALAEPDNYEARANLMWAATNALNDLTAKGKERIWVCHSMEHVLSAHYDITHGAGLAILTPHYMRYVLNDYTAIQLKRFAVNVFHVDESLDNISTALKGIEKLEEFFKSLNLPSTFSEVGIDDSKLEAMAREAYKPVMEKAWAPLHYEDILNIYKSCL